MPWGSALGIGLPCCNLPITLSSARRDAGILWKSHTHAEKAAEVLRFTSDDLTRFGVIDEVIREPLGALHRDHHLAAANLKRFLLNALRELITIPIDELVEQRYEKFRRIGEVAQAIEQRTEIIE